MTFRNLILRTSLAIVFGLFFFSHHALADVASSTPSSACTYPNNGYIRSSSGEYAHATFTLPTGTITNIDFHAILGNVFGHSNTITVYGTTNTDCTLTGLNTTATYCSWTYSPGNTSFNLTGCSGLSGSFTSGQVLQMLWQTSGDDTNYNSCDTPNSSNCLNGSYLDVTFTPGGGGGGGTTTTTDFSAYTLWGNIATSTSALVVSTVPFWEIAIGILLALFVVFFLAVGLSRAMKYLLKGR